jgi:hypothetical protein
VVVPLDLAAAVQGLQEKAKQGNAQAAGQYLQLLTRYPPVLTSGDQDMAAKGMEELTPAELAEFEVTVG